MNLDEKSRFIKSLAAESGFDFCGIAAARPLDEDARKLENWLQQGKQGRYALYGETFRTKSKPL